MISRKSFRRNLSYNEILDLQTSEFNRRINCRKNDISLPGDVVFFVEHNPVYTLGRHGKIQNLLLDEDELKQRGIEFTRLGRGGDITYHGPGQLTVYPILDLSRYRLGVKDYVDLLEEAVILTLADFSLKGERIEGKTGVWISDVGLNPRKICAIGIYCSRFVSMHGLALNVEDRLDNFRGIVPCGLSQGVTSISGELKKKITIDEVEERLWHNLTHLLLPRIPSQEIS